METRLNIIVRTDEDFVVETHHPYVEAKLAKEKCDEIAKTGGEHTVNTVSTDATVVYCDYASEVLGIEVHLAVLLGYLRDAQVCRLISQE